MCVTKIIYTDFKPPKIQTPDKAPILSYTTVRDRMERGGVQDNMFLENCTKKWLRGVVCKTGQKCEKNTSLERFLSVKIMKR